MIFLRHALLLLLSLAPALAQPAFEVADVKANRSGEPRMSVDIQPGGKFTARNVPMKVLIALAYHVRPDALAGGPPWLDSERFDIVAKAAETTASADDVRRMVQSLLIQRFGLATHTEQRPSAAFALVRGNAAPKLQRSDAQLLSERRCIPGPGRSGGRHVECHHIPMSVLADYLQELAPRDITSPVVDQTGLEGSYDFTLDFVPSAPVSDPPESGPTIFDAVETQLGLKLERRKLPLPVIVIDRISRIPSEN